MEITLKLAFAELRDVSRKWQSIGCHLDVGDLHIIRANYPRDDDCLDKVLRDWLRNGRNPSWKKLCDALEAAGLKAEAKHIREKYCTQGTDTGTSVTVEQPRGVATLLSVKSLLQNVLAHSKEWRTIGTSLGVDIRAVARRVSGNDEERLKAVLDEWLKKEKEPSWPKFCKALERAGLKDLAKSIGQDEDPSHAAASTSSTNSEYYILVKELKVEKVSWSIPVVNYSRTSQTDLSKGELLIRKGDFMHVKGNEGAAFKFDADYDNVAPLDDVQLCLLEAIPTPKGRFTVFFTIVYKDKDSVGCNITDNTGVSWLEWGAAVKAGDSVYIRVQGKGSECCSTARVHYIGKVTGEQPGTMFGVEITDSRYYGWGTTDGTFKGVRYFTCPDNNGLFLSLASVAKESEFLKLQYYPRRDIPPLTEGKQTGQDIPPTAAKRGNKEQSHVSASPNVGVNKGNDTNQLLIGARVILTSRAGRKVKGTVRWAGPLALDGTDPKEKIPVYCVETDAIVNWRDFEPAVSLVGRPIIPVSSGHAKVFIPQAMVELNEQIDGSDINVKNTAATKDEPKVAGGKFEESRQAALEKEKKKEKAELAKMVGSDIAGETDIDEQLKILEECKKAKQREDNISADRGVLTGGPSADRQYPAAQQNYPQSSSHLGRQSSSTQDPYQLSHSQPSSVPLQGDWSSPLVVGSAVIIPKSNPPIYGTIRWIGTISQVQGYIAGVELDTPLEGCTDGTWIQDGKRYFTCQPNRGYFCLLEHLIPADQRFMPDKEIHNPMENVSEDVSYDQLVNSDLFYRYVGDQKGIQGHQNSCYLDATLFGLFALSNNFDELFLKAGKMDKSAIEYIIWKNIVNPLRSCGAARYESVMKLRERLDDLGKMKGITKDEKDPEEFLNMLFKHVLHTEPFIQIRRPYGVEGEFFVQLFLESESKSDAVPNISGMLHRMFTEQDLSFTKMPPKLLIQVPRFGKQFKTYKRIIPDKTLNVSKLVHTEEDGFCSWCSSPATWKCDDCGKDVKMCSACSDRRHKNTKYKSHHPIALPKRADMELDLLSVICIETSHYVCFTRFEDRWLFFDSMANRVEDKYNIPHCTNCSDDLNDWVYKNPEKLLSAEPRQIPELVRRFTQDIYMCVYVIQYVDDMYASL